MSDFEIKYVSFECFGAKDPRFIETEFTIMIFVDNKSFRRLKLSHTKAEKLPRWTRSRKCENLECLSEEPSAAKRRPKVRGDLHELMKDYEYF